MTSPTSRLLPVTDDPDTGGFFAAAREHRLVAQTCQSCGNVQQPPRPRCIACHGTDLTWRDAPATGTVHSWTVVEHQINPHFPAPYTVLLVDVAVPGATHPVRYLGHVPGRTEPAVGDAVRLVFEDLAEGVTIPNWVLDD
ncbi:zinc ribbon domain-containing protein [Nocardioides sp. YIM 152315]|uniref:Zn-ribbon domain-containing OB-fold protein n=1 Tax=Nocardioides sp. YIM 152315 TaxID=3031760 RepID=UPI0023DCDCD7|nr:zinc ribbon domain-containing protein [Nocardioides sp. YIM 152315]MDF1602240.1 zinc ribbon domain-containing protein [Nocardioides sp. YIM 152315]